MIEARDLEFSYKASQPILRGISLRIKSGVIALVGPNGAGKTTLLKTLAALYPPSKGSVLIDGLDPWSLLEEEAVRVRRKAVYVHEKPLTLRTTVFQNVAYGLMLRGINRDEAESRIKAVMDVLGIADLARENARHLSAGQTQLVALARAVVLEPTYLLLDEPTANLDSSKRKVAVDLIRRLAERGVAVLVATHDQLFALRFADRAILLEEGSVRQEGSPQEILDTL